MDNILPTSINSISEECLFRVVRNLNYTDIGSLACVSRKFKKICDADESWSGFIKKQVDDCYWEEFKSYKDTVVPWKEIVTQDVVQIPRLCHLLWKSRLKKIAHGIQLTAEFTPPGNTSKICLSINQQNIQINPQSLWVEIVCQNLNFLPSAEKFPLELRASINNNSKIVLQDSQWHVPLDNTVAFQVSHVTGFYTWQEGDKMHVYAYVHFEDLIPYLQQPQDIQLLIPREYEHFPRDRKDVFALYSNYDGMFLYAFLDFCKIKSDLKFEICVMLHNCKDCIHNDQVIWGLQKFVEVEINGVTEENEAEIMRYLNEGEFLVDFSIYNNHGRLLLGRCGVETWLTDDDELAEICGIQNQQDKKFIKAHFNVNDAWDTHEMLSPGDLQGYRNNAFVIVQNTSFKNFEIGLRIQMADFFRLEERVELFCLV